MSLVVAGVNHKTSPVALLERLAIGEGDLPKALHQLGTYDHVLEAAVLSTCNRIEVYAVVSKFHPGVQQLRDFFADFCHVAPEDFVDHLYAYHDEAAVRHLLRVASGLDSMIVGESEILGQVRRSYQIAASEGSVQRVLDAAFRYALRAGKRARTETHIGRNAVSVSSAAVELARRIWPSGDLRGLNVAVVGAGEMGRLAARALRDSGVSQVTIVNRTEERGRELAEALSATARPWGELTSVLGGSDIVICSTTAPEAVIDRALVEAARSRRTDRPLLIVDIAVPRDVDASVATIPGVVLRDIDDLREVVEAGRGSRLAESSRVEEIILEEVARFMEWERSTDIAPTVAALLTKADAIRSSELARISSQLATMTAAQRDAVDRLTQRIVAKLVHSPVATARDLASSKQGHMYLAALRELFQLDTKSSADEPPGTTYGGEADARP